MKPLAISPHVHSHYSLDGAASPADFVKICKEKGQKTVILTEHGNLNSCIELGVIANKQGIKYANGIEAYIEHPFLVGKINKYYSHITIHFCNRKAYQYFCRISKIMESRAVVRFGERKPIITFDELLAIKDDIVVGTGCLLGFVNHFSLLKDEEVIKLEKSRETLIEDSYLLLKNNFPQLFVEIFPSKATHNWVNKKILNKVSEGCFVENAIDYMGNIDLQRTHNNHMLALVKKHGGMLMFSDDSHFVYPEQKTIQDIKLGNGNSIWKFHENYYLKDAEYCVNFFKNNYNFTDEECDNIINNSYIETDWLSDYSIRTAKEGWILMNPPENINTKTHLLSLFKPGKMPEPLSPSWYIYQARLEYEISVLKDNAVMDFLPYLFLVEKLVQWANEDNILVNLRGSGGGCLINYLLGISITDPIVYDLPFERFLTFGRILSGSMPDIDTDFSDKEKILNRLYKEFPGQVAQISTNSFLKVKGVIRDVERSIMGSVSPETEVLATSLPTKSSPQGELANLYGYDDENGDHVPGLLVDFPLLAKYKEDNPELWSKIETLLGVFRQKGSHACGIFITPTQITDYTPLTYTGKGETEITALDPKSIEAIGGLKYDILGVTKLSVIQRCCELVKERHNVSIEWGEFPHHSEVYEHIFHKGNLDGVFQFHTPTMRPYVLRTKPSSIEDLAAVVALVRPGCLDAPSPIENLSNADYYCSVRAKTQIPIYIHDDLIPILKNTNSIILYQEQVLRIFRDLAGYSFELAEDVRRGIGKKKKDVIDKHSEVLRVKLLERGWTKEQINLLVEQILASSKYSFNKSHAISYAIVAYNTAYLSHFYPLEYLIAELEFCKEEERMHYFNINKNILSPIVNISHPTKFLIKDDKIIAPLTLIKGVGLVGANSLYNLYPIEDFTSFCKAITSKPNKKEGLFIDNKLNSKDIQLLIASKVFEPFGDEISLAKIYFSFNKLDYKKQPELQQIDGIYLPKNFTNPDKIENFVFRKGINPLYNENLFDLISSSLFQEGWEVNTQQKTVPFKRDNDSIVNFEGLQEMFNKNIKANVYVVAMVENKVLRTIKKGAKAGSKFLSLDISDGSSVIPAVAWDYCSAEGIKGICLLNGFVSKDYSGKLQFSIKNIQVF